MVDDFEDTLDPEEEELLEDSDDLEEADEESSDIPDLDELEIQLELGLGDDDSEDS